MNISDVIAWKFNEQPGMRCAEVGGIMTIIEFPGGVPSQADQDLWTQEYIAAGNGAEMQKQRDSDPANVSPFLKALVLALNDGSFVPNNNYTLPQIKAIIKAKL